MSGLIEVINFASKAHEGQFRKYTNEPYIVHPFAVCGIVSSVTTDSSMLKAAILHDVVEDCEDVLLETIEFFFGTRVALLVDGLTDVSQPSDGNRALRKEIDLNHTAGAHPDAKTIKLADLIDNTKSITAFDPNFSVKYMREKKRLLEVLHEGNSTLHALATGYVEQYYAGTLPWMNPQYMKALSKDNHE